MKMMSETSHSRKKSKKRPNLSVSDSHESKKNKMGELNAIKNKAKKVSSDQVIAIL